MLQESAREEQRTKNYYVEVLDLLKTMNYCSFYLASGHGCLECSQYIRLFAKLPKMCN